MNIVRAGLALIIAATLLYSQSEASYAQFVPIDVFVTHNAADSRVTLYFANNLTGLSATTQIDGYANAETILDNFKLAANGVIYTNPANGNPQFITPGGRVEPLAFIPQSTIPPLTIDWVISEDGTTLAWAELSFAENQWRANIFTASIDGSNLTQLPTPPASSQATLRVRLLGVANDASRVLLDIDSPVAERESGQSFATYTTLRLYNSTTRIYLPIATTNTCPCPASVADDLTSLIQLERPIVGNGYAVRVWNINTNTSQSVAAEDTIFQQGGGIVASDNSGIALYSLTRVEGAQALTGSGIGVVNFINNTQRVVRGPQNSNLRVQRLAERGENAIIIDLATNTTFKFDLETNSFTLIADKMWLGIIQG